VRWGAITSADSQALQAPFRAGISIEDYQLDPVVRALRMPRVNLLIADDVGLGKTIEAGMVVQELLLRHRARTVFIVCPASLCVKWREEMASKFGLEFRIVDAALLRELRRRQGLYANPWTHYPRLIASIDWLKRERGQRLLREVLPAHLTYPRTFDLLIVDEVHTCAPSRRGRYATASLRTRALRMLGPHFEHRLFLSATPHNGYTESFTALLELLDPQRFARGVPPTPAQLRRVMIRRLKSELRAELPPKPDGSPRFPTREIIPLEVAYSDEERAVHAALQRYARSRAQTAERAHGQSGRVAAEFVLTLLKKRLFSSPAAFLHTLDRHVETLTRAATTRGAPSPKVLAVARDEVEADFADEEELETSWDQALEAAERFAVPLTSGERGLLDELRRWARQATDRGDTKSAVLLGWLEEAVRPGGIWNDERVIVFTEYRHTQIWLAERLAARGLAGDQLALLYGGMDPVLRERVKAEFQAHPSLTPVRILLATDAASEGIDLQRHCHRLVHVEIPWNPNRLEQRNGRIDRHGQPSPVVLIHHFVGAGWQHAQRDALEADLQFLYAAARKVEAIRDDLGTVGPVIAERVEQAMLGRAADLDTSCVEAASASRKVLKLERSLREEIARLRERLDASVTELDITPATIERVVRVGLDVARQPGLRPAVLDRLSAAPQGEPPMSVFEMPRLTGSWALAAAGLEHPVTGQRRPITFSHAVADGHDDVVLVHLGHRLVQQALRLLRAEVWATGAGARLRRVAARIVPDAALDEIAAVAYGRLVITGADGRRLHEEVITVGGRVRGGRFARMNVGETDVALAAATARQPDPPVLEALVEHWPAVKDPLANALAHRARTRAESLAAKLADRCAQEQETITSVLTELRETVSAELETPKGEQLALFNPDEREQFERDAEALRRRLDEIPDEIAVETAAIRARYATTEPRCFPAAVTFLVPERLAAARGAGRLRSVGVR
jgi:superfamily II DNA or RNA helicase